MGRLVALIGALAMVVQCLVVQTHLHRASDPGVIAGLHLVSLDHGSVGSSVAPHDHEPSTPSHGHGVPGSCFICQTALSSIGVLAHAPTIVLVSLGAVTNTQSSFLLSVVTSLRSHYWQSRAPPISFFR